MLKAKLSPSLMCGDIARLTETLSCFKKENIEYLHIDIMDGVFVPNFQFGVETVRQLRTMTEIPLDLHFMVTEPERKIEWFKPQPKELVSFHAESTSHIQRLLAQIRSYGAKAMLALNPATPLCTLEDIYADCDGILVMTVNPGFAGQKLVPATVDKVRRLRTLLDERADIETMIEVDGNVSFENAKLLRDAGADIFVGGTSSIYSKNSRMEESIQKLRLAVE